MNIEVIDVRRHASKTQIRGALRYDPRELLKVDHPVLPVERDRTIAVYGDSEQTVKEVVEHLRDDGYHAAVLVGGIEEWTKRGLPTEELTQEQPIPGK